MNINPGCNQPSSATLSMDEGSAGSLRRVVELERNRTAEWEAFLRTHESGMIYHTLGWKECIEKSFPHMQGRLLAVVDQTSGAIVAGLPVYTIKSWLLGNRISSVPFASVSDPLISSAADMEVLLPEVLRLQRENKAKSVEIRTWERSKFFETDSFGVSRFYKHHYLRLEGGADKVYRGFSKTAVQQRIRKAEKAGVEVRFAENEDDVKLFYLLLIQNRRRLSLPAIPYEFFKSLWDRFGPSNLWILLAFRQGEPVGAQLTLGFNRMFSVEYAGDTAEGRAGGVNQVLYWRSIKTACEKGYRIFSFGRTSTLNEGLLVFKRQFGAVEDDIGICIYPKSACRAVPGAERSTAASMVRWVSGRGPLWLNRMIGAFCYNHWG